MLLKYFRIWTSDNTAVKALSPGQTDSQVDASQRTFSTCVQLAFRLATHLNVLTCAEVHFGRAQIRTQVDASFSPFGHPT